MSNSDSPSKVATNYTLPIVITLAASFIVVAGLIVLLILFGKDPGPFLSDLITLIGVLPTLGVIGVVAGASAKKTDAVVKNTNGNLSKLQTQNQALLAVVTPEQVSHANTLITGGTVATTESPATVGAPPAPEPPVYSTPVMDANTGTVTDPVATPITPVNNTIP